jgi:ornithine cyclodeaminase/alanine dehydrogenase
MADELPRLLYLSDADVRAAALGPLEVLELLTRAFSERAAGRAEVPPKEGVHPAPDALLHAMPASIPDMGAVGLKWIAAYPGNRARQLPAVNGLVVLNDPDTGLPLAVMDAAWITAVRTAAASVLSARFLARPEASSLGVLGCGVQARSHLAAFAAAFPLRRVRVHDRHPERARALAQEMGPLLGLAIEPVDSVRAVVEGLDLVMTAGAIHRSAQGAVQPGWLQPGAFASLVDFDSAWSAGALQELDLICTDDLAQLQRFRVEGWFRDLPPVEADLAELVGGRKPGRTSDVQRTAACNLGLALGDVAVASRLYRIARERGLGTALRR